MLNDMVTWKIAKSSIIAHDQRFCFSSMLQFLTQLDVLNYGQPEVTHCISLLCGYVHCVEVRQAVCFGPPRQLFLVFPIGYVSGMYATCFSVR